MSENGPSPTYGGQPAVFSEHLAQESGQQPTTDVIKDQAAQTKDAAVAAGQQVATTTKEQAQAVVSEAGQQASSLLQQAQSELGQQLGTQHTRLVGGLRSLGDNLRSMADQSQRGPATDLARQASSKTHEIAAWLEQREPAELVDEMRGYARQRPGAFLAIAVGAGLLAGRLTRGVKDAAADSGSGGSTTGADLAKPSPATRLPSGPNTWTDEQTVDVTVVTPLTDSGPPLYAATRTAVDSGTSAGAGTIGGGL